MTPIEIIMLICLGTGFILVPLAGFYFVIRPGMKVLNAAGSRGPVSERHYRSLAEIRPSTRGEIDSVSVKELRGGGELGHVHYSLKVGYHYVVDGVEYASHITPYSQNIVGYRHGIHDVEAALEKQGYLTVYYDKINPADAFAVVDEYFAYPPFDRKRMLREAKAERADRWAGLWKR